MTSNDSLYPPSLPGIPADLAKPGFRYRWLVVLLLLALFGFLLIYLALMAGSLYLLVWAVVPPAEVAARFQDSTGALIFFLLVRIGLFFAAAMFFAFLFKGFFKRQPDIPFHYLGITQEQQPELYRFVSLLCQEIGSPLPARIYLNHEVNASVFFATSIWNLVVPPPKHLLIGLGLVKDLTVVEFKALLTHEFGHFSQRSLRLSGYALLVYRVMHNMVHVRDRWDNWMIRGFDTPWLSGFVVPLYMLVEWTRKLLIQMVRVLDWAHRGLRQQMEFNADLVAVSVTGSDAPVQLLLKSDFGQACLDRAAQDLALAGEQHWFTRDLFYHLERAAEWLRAAQNNPDLGRPPAPSADPAQPVQVFQPGQGNAAAMWADHPSHYDREQNAKRRYFPSPRDDRPAWLVFQNPQGLREEVTRRYYQDCLNREVEETPAAPEQVQQFIDDEREALTLDARFRDVYENRYLELEDFDKVLQEAQKEPSPTSEQFACSLRELYADTMPGWVGEHRQRLEEYDVLCNHCTEQGKLDPKGFAFRGKHYPSSVAVTLLPKVQAELEEDRRFLTRFDRSIFTLHYHLAGYQGEQEEFCQRYRFQLKLEQLLRTAWDEKNRVESVLQFLSSRSEVHWQEACDLKEVLTQARENLAAVLQEAGQLTVPALKHVPAGEPLSRLLPPELAVGEAISAEAALDLPIVVSLHQQAALVVDKLTRIQVKGLASILALQEKLVNATNLEVPVAGR
jgi:Zn-dependent protease with chaperone function